MSVGMSPNCKGDSCFRLAIAKPTFALCTSQHSNIGVRLDEYITISFQAGLQQVHSSIDCEALHLAQEVIGHSQAVCGCGVAVNTSPINLYLMR